MSKAERYIELVSDENGHLCDQHALKAVEIAREETIEKACYVIRHKYGHYHYLKGDITEDLIREFKQAMKYE